MTGIIRHENIETVEPRQNSSAQENRSSSLCPTVRHCLCGASFWTNPANRELIAVFSETNQAFSHLTLSEKLTPLLISLGLVRGTTLTFGRRLSSQGIPAGVSYAPDGSVVVIPRQVCISWKE